MDGFSVALSEITLVLFTTLAPSGAVAYLLMSLPVLSGRAAGDTARRLNQLTCLPLLVAMVGLSPRPRIWETPPTPSTCSRAWAAARCPPRCSPP